MARSSNQAKFPLVGVTRLKSRKSCRKMRRSAKYAIQFLSSCVSLYFSAFDGKGLIRGEYCLFHLLARNLV